MRIAATAASRPPGPGGQPGPQPPEPPPPPQPPQPPQQPDPPQPPDPPSAAGGLRWPPAHGIAAAPGGNPAKRAHNCIRQRIPADAITRYLPRRRLAARHRKNAQPCLLIDPA